MQRIGTFACVDCGTVVTRRKRADKPSVCLDCGVRRSVEAITEAARRRAVREAAGPVVWLSTGWHGRPHSGRT